DSARVNDTMCKRLGASGVVKLNNHLNSLFVQFHYTRSTQTFTHRIVDSARVNDTMCKRVGASGVVKLNNHL
ncbi:hypothetical protein PSY30_23715, partial [Shigella flexneri]|nr:hypothetical protein [Shigella flexneri]